jgi:hypothetical protein
MPFDFAKLIDVNYLTEQPSTGMLFFWPLVIILALLLVVSLICWRLSRRQSAKNIPPYKILINLTCWLGIPSVLGLILLFFRNQGIMYLSWRLWLEILCIVWLGGIVSIIFYIFFKFPKEKRAYELRQLKQKYIPQPKKHGGQIGDKNS